MWSFITAIPSLISGVFGTIDGITSAISNERIAGINAQTTEERIASDERVKALAARRDVLIAESSVSRANIMVRCLLAGPVIVILWKIYVWDKALGQWTGGHTDGLSSELWQVIMIQIGFYFLYEGAIGVTRILKR
jgi:hypothetical protein